MCLSDRLSVTERWFSIILLVFGEIKSMFSVIFVCCGFSSCFCGIFVCCPKYVFKCMTVHTRDKSKSIEIGCNFCSVIEYDVHMVCPLLCVLCWSHRCMTYIRFSGKSFQIILTCLVLFCSKSICMLFCSTTNKTCGQLVVRFERIDNDCIRNRTICCRNKSRSIGRSEGVCCCVLRVPYVFARLVFTYCRSWRNWCARTHIIANMYTEQI